MVENLFRAHRKHDPAIPRPESKEQPVVEELVTKEDVHRDIRPIMVKHQSPILVPRYNAMYGSLRSEDDWTNMVDNTALGTMTTVAGSTVSTPLTLTNAPNWRLSQWPGGVQLYLCIRVFSIAPQTNPLTTIKLIDCQFLDNGGQIVPLGDYPSSTGGMQNFAAIAPTPITDPGNNQIGSLLVFLPTGGTTSVYNFQFGFSAVYLLPAIEGYEVKHLGENHR